MRRVVVAESREEEEVMGCALLVRLPSLKVSADEKRKLIYLMMLMILP